MPLTHQTTGDLISATIWNTQVDQINTDTTAIAAAVAGGLALASQAAYDLLYAATSSQLGRIANGTPGYVFTAQSSAPPAWVAPSGAGAAYCQAHNSVAQALAADGSYNALAFDTTDSQTGSIHSSSTVFTVPTTGFYALVAQPGVSPINGGALTKLQKNGSTDLRQTHQPDNDDKASIAIYIGPLTAGDTISVLVAWNNGGGTADWGSATRSVASEFGLFRIA